MSKKERTSWNVPVSKLLNAALEKAVYVKDPCSVDFQWKEARGEIPDAW
jgi:hypothetical protein